MLIELLAPAKDMECLRAVVDNGANSVYMGYGKFNARMFGKNFSVSELKEGIDYAHSRNVKVYLTLNTLIYNDEYDEAVSFAERAVSDGIDGIIIQDIGLAITLHKRHHQIPIHASTQMTISNRFGVSELRRLGFSRVILARELNSVEIASLRDLCESKSYTGMEIEFFIHGGLCIAYSGQCYSSSVLMGSSANRGLCKMPCWNNYTLYCNGNVCESGNLIRPKDLCGLSELANLKDNPDTSKICLKIQGRLRPLDYIAEVVRVYRNVIDASKEMHPALLDDCMTKLNLISPRGLTCGNLSKNGTDDLIMESNVLQTRNVNLKMFDVAFSKSYSCSDTVRNTYSQISVTLHAMYPTCDYSSLNKAVNRIYVPLAYFFDDNYKDALSVLCASRRVYIYMPSMILERDSTCYERIPGLLNSYNIVGFMLSNLSDLCLLDLCRPFSLDYICNYTLNITNSHTARFFRDKGVNGCTFGFDTNIPNLLSMIEDTRFPFEQIVYGHMPLMRLKYCIPSHLTECHVCKKHLCENGLEYTLEGDSSFYVQTRSNPAESTLFNKTPYYVGKENWIGSTVRADFYNQRIEHINDVVRNLLDDRKMLSGDYIALNEIV